MKSLMVLIVILAFTGCVTGNGGKTVLDSSADKPNWVNKTRTTWEDDGTVFIKSMRSVKGSERLNGCYTLSEMDAREKLITEIKSDLKGSIDNAETSIAEDSEIILGKVRSSEFSASIHGLSRTEEYFERYSIGDVERIDCFTLNEIKQTDYNKTKRAVLDKVIATYSRIKDAITQKQIDFFKKPETENSEAH